MPAEGDRKRLQETLASSFMRASDQDMGFAGGSVGLRRPDQAPAAAASPAGSAPGGLRPAAALPSASDAAAAFLGSVGSRFASGGTLEPESSGLLTVAPGAAPSAPKVSKPAQQNCVAKVMGTQHNLSALDSSTQRGRAPSQNEKPVENMLHHRQWC